MSTPTALRERIALLAELRQIVQAMKNLAYAELQRLEHRRPALVAARDAVLQALAALAPEAPALPASKRPAPGVDWLVIGAERGFCGAFGARLAQAVVERHATEPGARIRVAGRRVAELLAGSGIAFDPLPGCAAIDELRPTLQAWIAAFDPKRELWLLASGGAAIETRRLWPRPEENGPAPRAGGARPLSNLAPEALRAGLRRQALHLLLEAGLVTSLEQENHSRLAQMQRAQEHLDELGIALRRRVARARQAQITDELETLMSAQDGAGAPLGPRRRLAPNG